MNVTKQVGFIGIIRATVRNADGSVFSETTYNNTDTLFLRSTVAGWLCGTKTTSTAPPPTQIGAGNGIGTPSATDTGLWSPISGTQRACDSISAALGPSAQFNITYQTSDPNGAYTEVGLFDASNNLWAHASINEIKSSGQTLTIQWMVMPVADTTNASAIVTNYAILTIANWLAGVDTTTSNPPPTQIMLGTGTSPYGVQGTDTALWTPTASITNLVRNSGFEVVTTTATLFNDALTSYTGSTVPAPWTLQSGSFTFGASGATCGSIQSRMSAGNAIWKPVLGSDGSTHLAQSVQCSFTTPATITSLQNLGRVEIGDPTNNNYYMGRLNASSGYLELFLINNGAVTELGYSAATAAINTSYTLKLQQDDTGALTLTLSGGASATVSKTDTTFKGGIIGVGGDTGVVISNASVTAPWANSWTIGGDSRVAWGLTQSAIGGKYSLSGVGVGNGILGNARSPASITYSTGTPYTLSVYMNTTNVGSGGAYAQFGNNAPAVTGTTSTTRQEFTTTLSSAQYGSGGTNGSVWLNINDSGTVTFDNIQLEQGSTANVYVENDSTTGSTTRNGTLKTCSGIYISASYNPQFTATYTSSDPQGAFTEAGLFDANGNLWLHATLTNASKLDSRILAILFQIAVSGD